MTRPTLPVRLALAAATLLVVGIGPAAFGQTTPPGGDAPAGGPTPPPATDESLIRDASAAFAKAFQSGDAGAVAGTFTDFGEYYGDDIVPLRGRTGIETAYKGLFEKTPKLAVETTIDAIRFLTKDTAVEEGTFAVLSDGRPATASRYSTLWVREPAGWKIAILKEWTEPTRTMPMLDDLAWLVGTWENVEGDAKTRVTYEWSETKAFLRSHFSVEATAPATAKVGGTQVIGVDRALGMIRSWTFDADGGFGAATWLWDGERWVIQSQGTLVDGLTTTAVNYLTPTGPDSFTWRSVERSLDAESMPDIGPIHVRRVARPAE